MILPKNKIEWTYNWVSFSQEDMQCTFTLPMAEPVQTFWLPAQSLWQLYCQQLLCNNWRLVSLHVSISQPPQHSVNQLSIDLWYSTSQLWTAKTRGGSFHQQARQHKQLRPRRFSAASLWSRRMKLPMLREGIHKPNPSVHNTYWKISRNPVPTAGFLHQLKQVFSLPKFSLKLKKECTECSVAQYVFSNHGH